MTEDDRHARCNNKRHARTKNISCAGRQAKLTDEKSANLNKIVFQPRGGLSFRTKIRKKEDYVFLKLDCADEVHDDPRLEKDPRSRILEKFLLRFLNNLLVVRFYSKPSFLQRM